MPRARRESPGARCCCKCSSSRAVPQVIGKRQGYAAGNRLGGRDAVSGTRAQPTIDRTDESAFIRTGDCCRHATSGESRAHRRPETPMLGQMMKMPLAIPSLIRHADRWHGDTEIVSRLPEGGIHRQDWSETHRRARRLASALTGLGVAPGDRVATLAWNTHRHIEIYYAVSG